jgi:glycosyltransferase involved in cell wall biosynthesis
VREVMRDGANARLYQAGIAASLAAALLEVAGDSKLARRLSTQAIADAGRFTYAARAERLIGLFKAGIAGR